MGCRTLATITFTFALLVGMGSFAHAQVNYVPGEVIVKLRNQDEPTVSDSSGKVGLKASALAAKADRFSKSVQSKGYALRANYKGMNVLHFNVKPGQRVEDAINDIQSDPDVEYAEPNYIFSKETVGGFSQTFSKSEIQTMAASSGYLATGAPIQVTDNWGTLSGGSVPVIAVIDTGLDLNHDIFADSGAVWVNSDEIPNNGIDDDHNGYVDDVNGWNFVANSHVMYDDDGHGTHVSGIVLGVSMNIYAASVGSAPIRIMPLKFLDGSGYGKTSDAIKAIYYAVRNGATVMNNSWGGPSYSAALHEAIAYAYDNGVLFVAAAGNDGKNNDVSPMYPASYNVPNVISVAATTDSDSLAYFSNYGKNAVDIASPGVYILSSVPGGGFGSSSGTSMAAPFVAGVAAIIKIEKPGMMAFQLKNMIVGHGDQLGSVTNLVKSNSRLNAYDALQSAKTATVETSQPNYKFTNEDRALASAISAGGCGLVQKMRGGGGSSGGPGSGGAPISWVSLFIVGLLALPMLIYSQLKRREDVKSRRKHDRFKIDSQVKINVGGKELVGNISTISLGGAQLNTNALIEQGGIVSMNIRSPDGKEVIQVEGRVVWSEAQKAYGIQFANAEDSVKSSILNWTKALTKA